MVLGWVLLFWISRLTVAARAFRSSSPLRIASRHHARAALQLQVVNLNQNLSE